jgi:Beta-lactamase enzyme family
MPLFPTRSLADFSNRSLDQIVKDAIRNLPRGLIDDVGQLGVALADLTDLPASASAAQQQPADGTSDPPYGGVNDTANYFGASCLKVAPMYAAYQLRSYLDEVAQSYSGKMQDFLTAVQGVVTSEVQKQIDTIPADSPALSKIFETAYAAQGGATTVAFSTSDAPTMDLASDDGGENDTYRNIRTFYFLERLKLMIMWSNDCASACCIEDLGFQYINALLRQAGLFDPSGHTGVWLGGSYAGSCTGDNQHFRYDVGPPPVKPRWESNGTAQVATPRALARLLRAIGDGSLLPTAGYVTEIMDLMDQSAHVITSFIGSGLVDAGYVASDKNGAPLRGLVMSKVGITANTLGDCALVNATVPTGKTKTDVSFALVVLGSQNGKAGGGELISLLARMLCRSLAMQRAHR